MASFSQSNMQGERQKQEAMNVLHKMSLQEKIAQKLMLDFRYWCPDDNTPCTTDFTQANSMVLNILQHNGVGGLILFSNNIKTLAQTKALTLAVQNNMLKAHKPLLLISTDQEGGIVARLPSDQTATFSGNMAITAATLGKKLPHLYAYRIGRALGEQLKLVGINVDNAPDVDVNVNPNNPVINVRSFSDDPRLVLRLGRSMLWGIQSTGVAATLKHFPGHGDTNTDSHTGLPIVQHDWQQAWNIDLYPFSHIVRTARPAMLMTAHIQFPALDSSTIFADKIGKQIITPATLSYRIQHDILRGDGVIYDKNKKDPRHELNFKGVSITDALDMGAIADNFTQDTAVIDAFKAGDDIALMPVEISRPSDIVKLKHLITVVVNAVNAGKISEQEIDASVLRILTLKAKLGLLTTKTNSLANKAPFERHQILATKLANASITLVKNQDGILPIRSYYGEHIHILTPWGEQGAAIAQEIKILQAAGKLPKKLNVSYNKISETTEAAQQVKVDKADLVIVGDLATGAAPLSSLMQYRRAAVNTLSPVVFAQMPMGDSTQLGSVAAPIVDYSLDGISDAQFAHDILKYAHDLNKPTIFISVLSPYDLPNYRDVADAMLVGYDYYGYLITPTESYFRGPAMQAIARVIFADKTGKAIVKPTAKLPVNVPDPNDLKNIIYPRGFGLSYEH